MRIFLTILMAVLIAGSAIAWDIIYLDVPKKAHEADWRDALAKQWNGQTEVVIRYGRIDVETDLYVIELDFLHKFHESLGQALHYVETGKQGVSALIVESKIEYLLNMDKLKFIEDLFNKYDIALVILLPRERGKK